MTWTARRSSPSSRGGIRVRVEAEVDILVAAVHFADLHNGDARDSSGRVLPGMEQAKYLGGLGTPRVMEFASAEFGARIGMHPIGARNLMADGLDLQHRLPRLWCMVKSGLVPVWQARKIAQMTRALSHEAAGFVDAQVAPHVQALGWSRLETVVQAKVIEADPDAEDARRRAASAERFVRAGRSNEHGLKVLVAKANAGDVVTFLAMVNLIADALAAVYCDSDPVDLRRSKAIGILANPAQAVQLLHRHATQHRNETSADLSADDHDSDTDDEDDTDESDDGTRISESDLHPAQNDADDPSPDIACPSITSAIAIDPKRLLPPATLYVHIGYDAFVRDGEGVARFEQGGPITLTQAREFLAHTHVTIKPVIDLERMAPVDAYEIPDRLREAVHLMSPADVFPFASSTSRGMDIDHTEEYVSPDNGGPPAQTGLGNLGPMIRFQHRIKTFGRWKVRQPFPGIFIWRDPHGRHYLVDHTGTHPLGQHTPARSHNPDLEMELVRASSPIDVESRHAA